MKRLRRIALTLIGAGLLLCLLAAVAVSLSNRALPAAPEQLDRLDPLDKARLAEALHLKRELGDQVWPGWGSADIAIILWNHGYSFLVGEPNPPSPWEAVPGDTFLGVTYFRHPTNDPQNFAVHVGERWAASMGTKWEADSFLMGKFREGLPGPLKGLFPYRALILPSEVQMTGVLHESFHAYQATVAGDRLDAAERSHGLVQQYEPADARMRDAWAREVDLLIQALRAESQEEARSLARQFLAAREQRRTTAGLPAELVHYERLLEWEEGLAKYVELATWGRAAATEDYRPLADMAGDPFFQGYRSFGQRFAQELESMKRSTGQEGEMRFYYTGMAQGMLLDRLLPGWQGRAFEDGIWLEDLLGEATGA